MSQFRQKNLLTILSSKQKQTEALLEKPTKGKKKKGGGGKSWFFKPRRKASLPCYMAEWWTWYQHGRSLYIRNSRSADKWKLNRHRARHEAWQYVMECPTPNWKNASDIPILLFLWMKSYQADFNFYGNWTSKFAALVHSKLAFKIDNEHNWVQLARLYVFIPRVCNQRETTGYFHPGDSDDQADYSWWPRKE